MNAENLVTLALSKEIKVDENCFLDMASVIFFTKKCCDVIACTGICVHVTACTHVCTGICVRAYFSQICIG